MIDMVYTVERFYDQEDEEGIDNYKLGVFYTEEKAVEIVLEDFENWTDEKGIPPVRLSNTALETVYAEYDGSDMWWVIRKEKIRG